MRFQLLRLPLIVSLVLALLAMPIEGAFGFGFSAVPVQPVTPELSVAHSAKTFTAAAKKKKKKKRRKRRRRSRRYTLRGNPEVTRKVATKILAEKLPELAELVGIEPIISANPEETTAAINDSEDPNVATPGATESTPVATQHSSAKTQATPTKKVSLDIPTTGVATAAPSSPDYNDSELSVEEDPDQLSEDDEAMLSDAQDLTITEFYSEFTDYMASLNGDSYITDNGIDKVLAMESLMEWIGTRYLFGGVTKKGIDCSAFTRTMYGSLGCKLPRTAAMQWGVGDEVEYEDLQFGDLVFFHTRKAVYVSHVGMYLGNGMFTHASSRNGVTISSLESNYYSTHYIGARRYDVAGAIEEAEAKALASRQEMSDTTLVQ